jgi:hypothetical protein
MTAKKNSVPAKKGEAGGKFLEQMRRHPDHCTLWASRGDWGPLLRYITLGGDLNGPSTRRVFADLVHKKMKRSVWMGPAYERARECYRASMVALLIRLGKNKTAAVAAVAEKWGVSEKTVWNNVRKWGLAFDHLTMDFNDGSHPQRVAEECYRLAVLAKCGDAEQSDFLASYPS